MIQMRWWTGPALVALLLNSGCGGEPVPTSPTPGTSPTESGSTPGTATPGTATPGTATPGTATPGTATPGTATPGTATPGTSTPGTATPGTSTPGTETPGTGTPGVTPTATLAPEVTPTEAPTPTPLPSSDLDQDGYTIEAGDCNDDDDSIHPLADEVPYDGIDQDCLEGDLIDVDEDGYPGILTDSGEFLDCEDEDPSIHPGQAEVCDGVDQNCNDVADEGLLITSYQDSDKDGFGGATSTTACTIPSGYDADGGDCLDTDAAVNPGAQEACNGKDDDCDTLVDDSDPSTVGKTTWYRDVDLDTYGDKTTTLQACAKPSGYVSNSQDCNDADGNINPAATELCNSKDDDCDALIDDSDPSTANRSTWYADADKDGYGTASVTTQACSQPSGYVATAGDCNDSDRNINPSASEICDGKDNNCNNQQDEGASPVTWYQDFDVDGYGSKTVTTTACIQPAGYILVSGDCDDKNAAIHPGATEVCNGKDDDCDTASDEEGAEDSCPGSDTECQARACSGGACTVDNVDFGTPVAAQTLNDCLQSVCDGSGGVTTVALDSDIPVVINQCIQGACSSGVPTGLDLSAGTACTQDGGSACNGKGACLPAFAVLRVGDASTAQSSSAMAVFLDYLLSDGTQYASTLPLPTAVNGANRAFTLAGTKTAEGLMTLSTDGHLLALAGYDAVPGTASVATTSSATVNRVVALVGADRSIDTTTRLDNAFSGESVRSVTTQDGTQLWLTGNSSGTVPTGGIHYTTRGALGSLQVLASPNTLRGLGIADNRLYAVAASTGYYGVITTTDPLPTTAGQSATLLSAFPSVSGPSPYSMVWLDLNPAIPGVDTLYLSDDRSSSNLGGIQKWLYDPSVGSWLRTTTFSSGLTVGVRGLAAVVTGDTVTVVATSAESAANKVIRFEDDGSAMPPVSIIATAPANVVYRGIAVAPR